MRPTQRSRSATLSTDTYMEFRQLLVAGTFNGQRLGQAFCNHFGLHNPKLFYTDSDGKAERIIREMMKDYQL